MNIAARKKIKNVIGRVSAALVSFFAVPFAAFAALDGDVRANLGKTGKSTGLTTDETGAGGGNLPTIVGQTIAAFLALVGVVLVVFIIYAGFLWMTAGGSEEKVTQAKTIIKNCVIGMIILFSAYAITQFVIDAIIKGTTVAAP